LLTALLGSVIWEQAKKGPQPDVFAKECVDGLTDALADLKKRA
jgi:hypothetical protein